MRVLHISPRLDHRMGGSAIAAADIGAALSANGVEVVLAGCVEPGIATSHLAERARDGLQTRSFASSFPRRFTRSRDLADWVSANARAFDMVEIHGVFTVANIETALACRRAGAPYVVRPHGQLMRYDLSKHSAAKGAIGPALVRPYIEGSRGVFYATDEELQQSYQFGSSAPPLVVPIPIYFEAPFQGTRNEARAVLDIPPSKTVVLFLGRLDPNKGLDLLLAAVARLRGRFAGLEVLLAGSGDARGRRHLARSLEGLGQPTWVRSLGHVSGEVKAAAFRSANLFALPSRAESFGISAVEAASNGLPLLLSVAVPVANVASQCGAAEVCAPEIESCTAALARLLESDLQARGAAAREYVRVNFDPLEVAARTEVVYESLRC